MTIPRLPLTGGPSARWLPEPQRANRVPAGLVVVSYLQLCHVVRHLRCHLLGPLSWAARDTLQSSPPGLDEYGRIVGLGASLNHLHMLGLEGL